MQFIRTLKNTKTQLEEKLSKFIKITTLSAVAMLCYATPSYAQFGSGSSYGSSIPSTTTTTTRSSRSSSTLSKAAEREAKKRADAAAMKEEALLKEKEAMLAKEARLEQAALAQKTAPVAQETFTAAPVIAAPVAVPPANCPAGTTAHNDGTCRLSPGASLPRS